MYLSNLDGGSVGASFESGLGLVEANQRLLVLAPGLLLHAGLAVHGLELLAGEGLHHCRAVGVSQHVVSGATPITAGKSLIIYKDKTKHLRLCLMKHAFRFELERELQRKVQRKLLKEISKELF